MKTILLLLASVATFAQSNLIVDSNMTLGNNCGNGQTQTVQVQDLNFNGNYTLTLKNVKLEVLGNVNGNGSIVSFCNNNPSIVCYNGYNNSNMQIVNCSSLSSQTFNIQTDLGLNFKIYDLNGRLSLSGSTHSNMFKTLAKGVYIVQVDGFKVFKQFVN